MTFEEILDQAMAMLQRRGRVAYRTLKVQFNLDDDALEALKDELLYAQQVARDEDGRVLVWCGGSATTSAPVPTAALPVPPPTLQEPTPLRIAPVSIAPHTPEAERRQLTVLFCDLADSTRLAGSSIPKTSVRSSAPIRPPAWPSSSALMGTLPSIWATACWSTLAIRRRTRTTPSGPCALAWACWRPWGRSIPGWTGTRVSVWRYGWASTPGWWWWAKWAVATGTNTWPWGRRQPCRSPPGAGRARHGGDQCGDLPPGAGVFYLCRTLGPHAAQGHRHPGAGVSGSGGKRGAESPGRSRRHRAHAAGGPRPGSDAAAGALGAEHARGWGRWWC